MPDFITQTIIQQPIIVGEQHSSQKTEPKIMGTIDVPVDINKAEWWRGIAKILTEKPDKALVVEFKSYYEICLYRSVLSNGMRKPSEDNRAKRLTIAIRTRRLNSTTMLIWTEEKQEM